METQNHNWFIIDSQLGVSPPLSGAGFTPTFCFPRHPSTSASSRSTYSKAYPRHISQGFVLIRPGNLVNQLVWLGSGKSDEFMGILDSTDLGVLNVKQNQDGTGPALQFAVHTKKKDTTLLVAIVSMLNYPSD